MLTLTSPHKTWAHRLTAGTKLAALCAATILFFALKSPVILGLCAGTIIALTLSCGPDFARQSLRALRPIWPFIVIVALWHDANWATVILRMICALSLANFVTMTTRLSDMIAVLQIIALPLSHLLPPRRLALAIALVVRFIPIMLLRADEIGLAWRARSARRPRWRIVIPITLSTLDDAERVAEALRARGGIH
jgi:biotin transport system permease protein